MDSQFFDGVFWALATLGGVGVFIDFLIGVKGQETIRDAIQTWWLKFDDVRWHSIGSDEALWVANLLIRHFGTLFSHGRKVACSMVVVGAMGLAISSMLVSQQLGHCQWTEVAVLGVVQAIATLPVVALGLAVSITLTVAISKRAARFSKDLPRAVLAFLMMLVAHGILLIMMAPVRAFFLAVPFVFILIFGGVAPTRDVLQSLLLPFGEADFGATGSWNGLYHSFTVVNQVFVPGVPNNVCSIGAASLASGALIDVVVNVARIVLSIVFVLSFTLRPIVEQPLLLIWLRIAESKKPIFTMVFGAVALIAKVIQEGFRTIPALLN